MKSESTHSRMIQRRFGSTTKAYATSRIHAHGDDLETLISTIRPQVDWVVADIATGVGHTAGRLAPHVRTVIACDLTEAMLNSARQTYSGEGLLLCASDAENLPFASESLDLITCRFAAHHFPDVFRFVQMSARALKPGGQLAVIDHLNPDDPRAANYLDAFERLRDPSHIQAYAEYEWRGLFLDAGLNIMHVAQLETSAGSLDAWAKRQNCPEDIIQKLHVMLCQMPETLKAFVHPTNVGTSVANFFHQFIFIVGQKPITG